MKAARIHEYGASNQIRIEDVPVPEIGPDEALVRVKAASVNPVDWKIREGTFRDEGDRLPMTLGQDFAGVVEKAGSQVIEVRPGDEVFGQVFGSYAEYIAIKARDLAKKPARLDFVQAASVPMVALTAWQAIVDHAQLSQGDKVLIHGASGGVGSFLVQFAKLKGAKVYATASRASFDELRALGADELIDYHAEPFERRVSGVDAVMDLIGGETQARSWQTLKRGGVLINFIGELDEEKARQAGVRGIRMRVNYDVGELEKIGHLLDAGRIRCHIAQVFPLDQAKAAQDLSQSGHPHGKIVLRVA